jgi:hypothetical protein
MITREQIEGWRNTLSLHSKFPELDAIFDLALQALNMQPRPIAETKPRVIYLVIGKNGNHSLAYFNPDTGCWMDTMDNFPIRVTYQPTHFIPLSSLPKVQP